MKTHRILTVCVCVLGMSSLAVAQQAVFDGVVTRFSRSETDRRLVDKSAELTLDDGAQKLIVKNDEHPLAVRYKDIQRVVFDTSIHRRGENMALALIGAATLSLPVMIVSASHANKHVNYYWCYLEYGEPDASVQSYMLEIPKKWSPTVIDKMQALFGSKVTVAEFPEAVERIKKNTLKHANSKYALEVVKDRHPLPEMKADKALIVVVCPSTRASLQGAKIESLLYANDDVVAVNGLGTYAFAYLDPGDYLLLSQTRKADGVGIRVKVEAGQDYYFLQDILGQWNTALSRHSKALVMYELGGAYYASWEPK